MFSGRIGGRVAVTSEIEVKLSANRTDRLKIYSTHLESGTGISDLIQSMFVRNEQISEMVDYSENYFDAKILLEKS